ncbi:zinc finger MYND domain-containing protein 15 isoform X2 [Aplysia californica]|nr:zinc finger MYND domain-containing protein 15 isoform X2 [Aplysia californica]
MAVFEVHGNTKHLLGTSIGWSKIMNFKTQLLQLLCCACLEPLVKAPRRPRFLRIKASPQSRGLNLNLKGVGIHVFSPLVTDSAIANAQNHISDKMWFRSCHGCGRRGTSEMFTSCPDCDAVLFCDAYCRDYSDHSKWCPYFKVYMETEETLGEFPLAFTNETTQRLYNVFKNRDFLMRHNIYNKGIWRRECKLLMVSLMAFGFGELDWPSVEPYGLSKEDAILKHPPQRSIPSLSRPLTDWACYYDYRGFDHDSPVAGVLHYALTLYRIIVHQLPLNYPAVFNKMKQEMFLCVHVIGAAKEADMWHSFLECARLLRPISLHICFIGNEISPDAHDSFKGEENLCVRCFSGLYHELQRYPMFPEGHIAVCFNAGLGAYGTYKKTVQHLMSTGMPSFCTDYCLASYEQSRKTVRVQRMAVLSEPMLNPFRSPFRMVFTDTDLPRYSNAILFNLLPYSATTAPMVFVPRSFCKNHSKQECTSEVYKLSLLPDDL